MHLFSFEHPTISVSARRDMTARYFFMVSDCVGLMVYDKGIGLKRVVGAKHIVGVEGVEVVVIAGIVYLVATA